MAGRRHEFGKPQKDCLGKRTGGLCCMCGCSTTGPNIDPTKATNIGQAAHITAAANGGPRYDKKLSEEERKSVINGMLLCANCHIKVDSDPDKYPVEVLRKMKEEAEMKAGDALGIPQKAQPIQVEEVDNPAIQQALQKSPEMNDLMVKIGYKARNKWTQIATSLKISENDIDAIDIEHRGRSDRCYMAVFNKWKKATIPPYTWATIIVALKEVGEEDIAAELKEWLSTM